MGIGTSLRLFFVVAPGGAACGGSGDEPAAGPTSTVTAAISLADVTDHVASASPAVALAVLQNADHNTFTDSCPEIQARGGVLARDRTPHGRSPAGRARI